VWKILYYFKTKIKYNIYIYVNHVKIKMEYNGGVVKSEAIMFEIIKLFIWEHDVIVFFKYFKLFILFKINLFYIFRLF